MTRKFTTRVLTFALALLLILALPGVKADAAENSDVALNTVNIPGHADIASDSRASVAGGLVCNTGFQSSVWEQGEQIVISFLMKHGTYTNDMYYIYIKDSAGNTFAQTSGYIKTNGSADASTLSIYWVSSGMAVGKYYVEYWSTYNSTKMKSEFNVVANNGKSVTTYTDAYFNSPGTDWHDAVAGNKQKPHTAWEETFVKTASGSGLPEYGITLQKMYVGAKATTFLETQNHDNTLPFGTMQYVIMAFKIQNYGDVALKVNKLFGPTSLYTSYGSRMTVNAVVELDDSYATAVIQPGQTKTVWFGVGVKQDQGMPVIMLPCKDGYTYINTDPKYKEPAGEWVKVNGKWYFTLTNGKDATGWMEIEGEWYYFNKSGVMQQGWILDGGKWYYLAPGGAMVSGGWKKIDSQWYYFEQSGAMAANKWVRDGQYWCYMNSNGLMTKNKWVKDGAYWCYLGSNGYMVTNDWAKDGNKWCYLDKNGYMVTSKWIHDGMGWCYIGADGYMVTNKWIKDSVGWCYVGADGYMVKNQWAKDGAGWCYLGSNGYMVKNQWAKDGVRWCYLGSNGHMVTNKWVHDGAGWCYLGSDGYMCTNQWIRSGTTTSYVGSDGRAYTGVRVIGGKKYTFDSNGNLIS